uniref:Platelet-derived growth factor (PDGF) family profile domain-containing protein n=1 Tax=Pelusios castaneus TaxID=367368 RepID=A0A8C8SR14_9SAUR
MAGIRKQGAKSGTWGLVSKASLGGLGIVWPSASLILVTPPPLVPAVIPFEEVWSRSYCRTLETLVDVLGEFPHEAEHVFKPACVLLRRCAGCCGDEDLECVAVETHPVAMQVGPGWGHSDTHPWLANRPLCLPEDLRPRTGFRP